MHPLIARIHPALRTAVVAWFFSRSILWLIAPHRPAPFETGTPIPGLFAWLIDHLSQSAGSELWLAVLHSSPWVILETLILVAGVAVYRFARTTDLPQVAERACWLWFFNPLLAMSVLDWGTQMAAATGAIAIAGVVTHRPKIGALAAVIAVGCRLEFMILWPALLAAGWIHLGGRQSLLAFALYATSVPIAFSGWIAASWHLAGATNTSLRSIHGDASWRDASALMPPSAAEAILWLALVAAAVLALRYLRRFPLWYALCAVPAVVWPFFQVPVSFAAITVIWSLPTALHFAVATDDRSIERPLLVGLATAFFFAALQAGIP